MAEFGIQVEGVKSVQDALNAIDAKVRVKAMKAALHAAGVPMRAAIQERAPERVEGEGGKLPPGALAADVILRVTQEGGQLFAVIEFGGLTYYVARWVEYGHRLVKGGYSSMKRGKLQGHGHQIGNVEAHPFIRPAFEATTKASFDAFVAELQSQLKGKS
jgi:HK97 gp10 family phage protein